MGNGMDFEITGKNEINRDGKRDPSVYCRLDAGDHATNN